MNLLSEMKLFFVCMFTKGYWKFPGRTCKSIGNRQRLWIALSTLIGSVVNILTLGNITCWADIALALEYNVGNEDLHDVAVLCKRCHGERHGRRCWYVKPPALM